MIKNNRIISRLQSLFCDLPILFKRLKIMDRSLRIEIKTPFTKKTDMPSNIKNYFCLLNCRFCNTVFFLHKNIIVKCLFIFSEGKIRTIHAVIHILNTLEHCLAHQGESFIKGNGVGILELSRREPWYSLIFLL